MAVIRRLLPRLLAVVLCLGLLVPIPAASASNIYFTAINETISVLTADTMPVYSGGLMYVPYTVFDSGSTGIDLGMYCSYSRTSNTVTLFNLRQMLVFDLSAGTCRNDVTGEYYSARAITRNGRPYVPVEMVCSFFGLEYSLSALSFVDQGYLVRIKSSAVVLDDETFIDAAVSLINQRLRDYNQSLAPAPGQDTSGPEPNPGIQVEDDDTSSADVRTYLAFRCEDSGGVSGILDTLDSYGLCGVFFLTEQMLAQEDDLVRRILGSGHTIGLAAEGADAQQTLALLGEGNRILEQKIHLRTTVAYVPEGQRSAVEAEGWICWDETLSLAPTESVGAGTFATSTIRRLAGRTRSTYLTFAGDENTARVLPTLLRRLDSENFVVNIPLETRL